MKVISLPEGSVQWPIGTTAQWVGRNGTFDSIGVYYYEYDEKVALHPVGARGKIGNCMIEVPKASIPDLISSLCKALRFSPDSAANTAKAECDTSTPSSVALGKGESLPRLEDITLPCELNGIPRMDEDFMRDVERR